MIVTGQMMWDAATKTFIAEMSELQARFEQIWPDSCDIGFRVASSKTGKEARFFVDREVKNNEGEIEMWILKPVPEDIRRLPGLEGVMMKIFND